MNTLLICLIVCSVYSFVIYRVLSRRVNKKIDNKTFLNSVKEEINSLINQINETSDRNVLLVENRLEKISLAIAEADRKLAKLKTESKVNIETKVTQNILSSQPVIEPEVMFTGNEVEPEKIEPIDDPSLTRRERILLLHKQGISPTVIASQTKATIGEVELIISVNRG
ncbi:MAG: hypothetical protein OCD02_23860 [Spirochaetaceae bacterium]